MGKYNEGAEEMCKSAIFYNENSYCNSCMMCVRSCQIKAIKFIDNLPRIVDEYCVNCGQCYNNCPPRAIKYTDSVEFVKNLFGKNRIVIASISPTWVGEFRGLSRAGLIKILKKMGFTHVSETTLGAAQTIKQTVEHLKGGAMLTISSACPAICDTVVKYYPHLAEFISPFESPTVSHAKLLKNHYGEEAQVVTINSCVAEKTHVSDEDAIISATVTFNELNRWMEDLKIDYKGDAQYSKDDDKIKFDPFDAASNHDYIFASGSIVSAINQAGLNLSFISFSGMENAINTLDLIDINHLEKQTYVNLLACKDGCISSSGSVKRGDNILKILTFKDHYKNRVNMIDPPSMKPVGMSKRYVAEEIPSIRNIDVQRVSNVLASMYISPNGKLINCGKCGYPTCMEFAKGVVRGMTQKMNCVPHYQSILKDNFSIMIKNLPHSVFVVDNKLRLVETNELFLETIGISKDASKEVVESDAILLVPFLDEIKQMHEDGATSLEKDVIIRGKSLRLTMFTLKNNKFICGIVRNMLSMDARDDEIITRTRKVINENLDTVQQIAYLLGENVSRTEALLNSMIELHTSDNKDSL